MRSMVGGVASSSGGPLSMRLTGSVIEGGGSSESQAESTIATDAVAGGAEGDRLSVVVATKVGTR